MTTIQYHTIRFGHFQMSYLRAGEGTPLLLIHGFPQHLHMWRKVMERLVEIFLVVAPGLRGMGGSSILPGGYDKQTLAEDLMVFVQALSLREIHLVGYDLASAQNSEKSGFS